MKDLRIVLSILVLTLALPFAQAHESHNSGDPQAGLGSVLQNDDQILQAMTDTRNGGLVNVTGENCCDPEKVSPAHLTDNTNPATRSAILPTGSAPAAQ